MTGSSTLAAREAMVVDLCRAVDEGDAERFGSWFTDESTYRFGGGEILVGRAAVVAATNGAIDSLPWVRHTVDQVAQLDDQLFCRFTIETENPGGTVVAMPCVTVIRMTGDRIADYRVHMDLSPAFAS
jgi:hypothetical protein